jgi:hypothetical protein
MNTLDAILGSNRGRGRETAGKPENPRIAIWHRLIVALIGINQLIFSHGLDMVRNFCFGKLTAGVVRAARGGKDGASLMSETKRDYEIGRGKPPVHSRFKKGQSGNPRGPRPKKSADAAPDALKLVVLMLRKSSSGKRSPAPIRRRAPPRIIIE